MSAYADTSSRIDIMEKTSFIHTVNHLAAVVRETRRHQGVTQAQLAAKAGVSRQFVIEVEAGHPRAEVGKVLQVLSALGLSPRAVSTLPQADIAVDMRAGNQRPTSADHYLKKEGPEMPTLIPTKRISSEIRRHLLAGDQAAALRDAVEIAGRIRGLETIPEGGLPAWATEEPPSTDSARWDTILATGMAYAIEQIGGEPEPWMNAAPPLEKLSTLAGDDPGEVYKKRLLAETPARFLSKKILSRDRDWTIA